MTPPMPPSPSLRQNTPYNSDPTLSILALVFGILSWMVYCVCGIFGFFMSIAFAITSILCALQVFKRIKQGIENPNNKGMAVAGLVTSIASFISFFLMTIFFILYFAIIAFVAVSDKTTNL